MFKVILLLTFISSVFTQLTGNYGIFGGSPPPPTPTPTTTTTCAACNGFGEPCLVFSTTCSRNGCCGDLWCAVNPNISDVGGVCMNPTPAPIVCPKCQAKNQRCQVFSTDCTRNDCCAGYSCNLVNPNITDTGGVCKKSGCPACNGLGSRCLVSGHSWTSHNSCARNDCCPAGICVRNHKHPLTGGLCQPLLP